MDKSTPKIKPIRDPLMAAMAIKKLTFRSTERPRAFPEPPTAVRIEHRARYDRLKAAADADVFLFQSTQQYLRRPGNPNLSDRLVSALGVWAMTRSFLGLPVDALVSMTHVLRWIEACPGTSSSAFTFQRSARLVAGEISRVPRSVERLQPVLDQEIHTALYHHLLTEAGEEAAGAVLLDMACMHFESGDYPMARMTLRSTSARLGPQSLHRFEVHRLIVLSHLREGSTAEALEAVKTLKLTEADLSKGQRLDALSLEAELLQAAGRPVESISLRLQALKLSTGSAGAEVNLDQMVALGEALEAVSEPLTPTGRELVAQAVERLIWEIDQPVWFHGINNLHRHLISGPPFLPPPELVDALRERLILHHQQQAGGESVLLTVGPTLTASAFPSPADGTTVGDDDWN